MENTIFNVYVPMGNQEQCDRMKQLCIDNELPYWNSDVAFEFRCIESVFAINIEPNDDFFVLNGLHGIKHFTKVTESEFIDLLKKHKL